MNRITTSGAAFAAANAAMVRGVDAASTVHVLLADCVGLLGADTAGVLVRVGEQQLELLAATSHKTIDLELHQVQVHDGPCVDTIEGAHVVAASGTDELVRRWPGFGRAMSAAGLETVQATPMRWHGRMLGGLNVFWTSPRSLTDEDQELAQAFADIATLALMQPSTPGDSPAVAERLRAALHGRVVIERAKGVLAYPEHLEMDAAFSRLVQLSQDSSRPLAEVAQSILDQTITQHS